LLFLCTETFQVAVIEFDASLNELVTVSKGDLASRVGYSSDLGVLGESRTKKMFCSLVYPRSPRVLAGAISPNGDAIALRLYEGLLKVIPLRPDGTMQDAFDIP
jgi:hypothetical protein